MVWIKLKLLLPEPPRHKITGLGSWYLPQYPPFILTWRMFCMWTGVHPEKGVCWTLSYKSQVYQKMGYAGCGSRCKERKEKDLSVLPPPTLISLCLPRPYSNPQHAASAVPEKRDVWVIDLKYSSGSHFWLHDWYPWVSCKLPALDKWAVHWTVSISLLSPICLLPPLLPGASCPVST